MAYISANEIKSIRAALKAKFPEFKFGVRKGTGSYSADVIVKSGPVDFNEFCPYGQGYAQINHYHLGNYGEHAKFFEEVLDVIKTAPGEIEGGRAWFDESDSSVDYFHTAYYIHISVGEWNKPYVKK